MFVWWPYKSWTISSLDAWTGNKGQNNIVVKAQVVIGKFISPLDWDGWISLLWGKDCTDDFIGWKCDNLGITWIVRGAVRIDMTDSWKVIIQKK